jgi:hypothetical protein
MTTSLWEGLEPAGLPLEAAVEPIVRRLQGLALPSSTAELRLSTEDVSWLRSWFAELTDTFRTWLSLRNRADKSRNEFEQFGLLFLVLAAETVREQADEESAWPFVQRVFSPGHGPGTRLFRSSQPSSLCKAVVEAAARRFQLRHALDIDDAQRYYTTLKLQVGFTYEGGIHRLGDWLDGLGVPQAVQILLARTPQVHLESRSFAGMWSTLSAFRRGKLPETAAKTALRESPWLRPHWVEPLLRAAGHHARPSRRGGLKDAQGIVELGLEWPPGQRPRFLLALSETRIESLFADPEVKDLCLDVDGRVVDRWLKQGNGKWLGARRIAVDEEDAESPDLQPAALTLSASVGNRSHVVDLTALGTRDDVVVFDLSTSRVCPADAPMSSDREYALVCASDLALAGVTNEEHYFSGPRRVFRLEPGWPSDVRLVLDELTFWEPSIEGRSRKAVPRVLLTTPSKREADLGSDIPLAAEGLPDDILACTLRISNSVVPLTKDASGSWTTSRAIKVDASLALGLERMRIESITPGGRRIFRPKLSLNLFGIAVMRGGKLQDGQTSWITAVPGAELNIAIESGHIRLFPGESDSVSLLEGTTVRAKRVPTRPVEIDKLGLGGWGAKLTLWGRPDRPLATSVQDRGRVFSYFYYESQSRPDPPQLRLASPIEPDARHSVIVWPKGRLPAAIDRLTSQELVVTGDRTIWQFSRKVDPQAVGLAFDGVCLGSWWDKSALHLLLRTVVSENLEAIGPPLFALLRWFKVPVLSQEIRPSLQTLVNIRPLDFARTWLGSQGLPNGLRSRPADKGVQEVVRELLWRWRPQKNFSLLDKILRAFAPLDPSRSPSREVAALVATATICPPLLRDLSGSPQCAFATTALRAYLGLQAGGRPGEVQPQRARLEAAYKREAAARDTPALMAAEDRMDSAIPCGLDGRRLLGAQLLLALSSNSKMGTWAKSTR